MFINNKKYAYEKEKKIEKIKELAKDGYLPIFITNRNWLYMVKNKRCIAFNGISREEVFSFLSGLCSLSFLNRAVIQKDFKMEILDYETNKIRINCKFCTEYHQDLVLTKEQLNELLKPRGERKLIQDILPEQSPETRELFISGMCPNCWDKLLGIGGKL